MADESSGAGGAMWALVTLLIVLVVVAALYFGGAFRQKKSIDININKPGVVLPLLPGVR
jgi:Flp pilus assembly protein TadG